MRRTLLVAIPAVAVSVVLAACGSSSSSNSAPSTPSRSTAAQQPSSTTGTVIVKASANSALGTQVLTNSQGMTLYALSAEAGGKFICTSACLQVWHPLTVSGTARPSGSVGALGTIKRPDGSTQVTFHGRPLYTFAQDRKPGDVNGQGVKDVGTWDAVQSAAGTTTTAAAPPAPATTSTPAPAGAYGY